MCKVLTDGPREGGAHMLRKTLILIAILSFASLSAFAAPAEYDRLARISYLDGHVSFQHTNEVDWTAASINVALQPGDRIYTGEDGRAEIQIDDGSVLHLAERTDVEFLALREEMIQIRVLVGLATLNQHSSIGYEVNTPAAAFNTLRPGTYRFDVVEDGNTDAIVRKGILDAANDTFSTRVEAGDLLHVTAGEHSTNVLSRYGKRDAWDEWTDRREADQVAYDSRKYLPDNVYMGASDLDEYGRWVVVDSYGPAWVPTYLDAGWSPYSVGRWWYRPVWGWTWVSYEPWGWLPYHYGRWYHHSSFGWCWLPGASFGFHFWSPGLVRFYQGPSWVSWCPLGPGDYYNVNNYYYNPTYNYYLNRIRLTQNRGPEDLVNRSAPGAFHSVHSETFINRSFGSRENAGLGADASQPWRQGKIVTDRLTIQPTSRSYSPAPDRPVVRPSSQGYLPSVVRTMPSAIPDADSRGFVRIKPAPAAATSGRESGRDYSNSMRNGSGSVIGRPSANSGSDGSPVIDRTPGRQDAMPERGNRSYGRPNPAPNETTAPAPGREMRNETTRDERNAPGRRAPNNSSGSGASAPNPQRNDRPLPAPRTEPAPSRRMESAPAAPRNEKPAAPERPKPQEKPRNESSSYTGRSYTPPPANSYSAPQTRAYSMPEFRRSAPEPRSEVARPAPAGNAFQQHSFTAPPAGGANNSSAPQRGAAPRANGRRN